MKFYWTVDHVEECPIVTGEPGCASKNAIRMIEGGRASRT
jgi:hypothetical protein